MKKIIKSSILASLIFLVMFLTIGLNIIRNLTDDPLSESMTVSVPVGTASELNGTSFSIQDVITSSISPNQTNALQDSLQNQVLSSTTTVSTIPSISVSILPKILKVDPSGTIRDIFQAELIKLSYFTDSGEPHFDITDWSLKIDVDAKTEKPSQSVKLDGVIKVFVNDVEQKSILVSANTISDSEKSFVVTFDDDKLFEFGKSVSGFNIGNNKIKVVLKTLSGTIGTKSFSTTDVILYQTDIDFSPYKVIIKKENGLSEKVYPSDSSLTIGSIESEKLRVESEYCGLGCARNRVYHDGFFYPPVVKDLNVFDVNGNVIHHSDSIAGKVKLKLQRNTQYRVTSVDPLQDFTVSTPEDRAVDFIYYCVTLGFTYSPKVVCGHP